MNPVNIPQNKDITYLGLATYRDKNQLFGIKRKDRRQHVYILGKSGTGKSVFMFNMIIQNIKNGDGVCLVDPHGENVEAVLSAIPPERVKDVVYFNPADPDYHIGFNVLEIADPKYKHLVASGLMGIFTKIWANAWSARMEYILNNAILALLDTPGTTMLGIPRLLVDKDYRQKIISNLKDPVIKSFWVHEYEAWQDKFRNEAIAPIQNKVGQFLSSSIIRNVVGQSKSTINIFDLMNEKKIFLVNVSKGRIGEDNSALLGGMIITKIQLAAMERVRIPEDERKDFYLYVDEFQNFVTDSFASILSEARKYRLNLTVAHQYTAQLVSDKSSAVRDAVFGNVGTMVVFRCGAEDADFLEKEFDPEFTPQDIVALPNYKIYLKLMIDGITSRPFSAKTLPPMAEGNPEIEKQVIESSRALYCKKREDVEREINAWSGSNIGDEDAEKFTAVCSICAKETKVPFKPEPGRPVYCKDCITKIKSGEIKPVKGTMRQIRNDESKYFKPLADLGIEFGQKDTMPFQQGKPKFEAGQRQVQRERDEKKNVFSKIKGVFVNNKQKEKSPKIMGENLALKEILNKTLNENKVLEDKDKDKEKTEIKQEIKKVPEKNVEVETKKEAKISEEEKNKAEISAVSLNELKTSKPTPVANINLKDRAAPAEEMNKLKDLISKKENIVNKKIEVPEVETKKEASPVGGLQPREKILKEEPEKEEVKQTPPTAPQTQTQAQPSVSPTGTVREVPEDVLRKILE
ncbi:MAG TPA: type IV secretion system DNA-binding domain-containing protein [Candidatus Paceibacterota bacterium]|nr:type IV secretion system DNA-binding domain-containing protein [Candidatus Paceibacterota bacterium]